MQNPPPVTPGPLPPAAPPPVSGIARLCDRHYRVLAVLTLTIAAFNLGFRLNQEFVTAWDESLYATSAAEMVRSGNWLVTTFHGDVDYYNTKPPLNIWLIAASFKLFGVSLWSLRLPSVIAAWLTIAVLQRWVRVCLGATTALATTLVLSTTFAFLYVHSARSGNPDAWLTLDIVLTVVTLWSARTSPGRLVWLGPLAAAAFLLKGTAVLLPVFIACCVLTARRLKPPVAAVAGAVVLFVVPSALWAVARWRFDRWRFFDAMFNYDFVARATQKLEGHDHGWLYYLDVLQKDHYDWLATALVLVLVIALSRRDRTQPRLSIDRDVRILLGVWAGATLLVPTLMATKLAWYLNPFYPVFAVAVAVVITAAFNTFALPAHRRERVVVSGMVLLAFAVAEGKLVWYSYNQRDLARSLQGFFIESRQAVAGRRVLQEQWDPADRFVLEHIAHGMPVSGNPQQAVANANHDDLLILQPRVGGWVLTSSAERGTEVPTPADGP